MQKKAVKMLKELGKLNER